MFMSLADFVFSRRARLVLAFIPVLTAGLCCVSIADWNRRQAETDAVWFRHVDGENLWNELLKAAEVAPRELIDDPQLLASAALAVPPVAAVGFVAGGQWMTTPVGSAAGWLARAALPETGVAVVASVASHLVMLRLPVQAGPWWAAQGGPPGGGLGMRTGHRAGSGPGGGPGGGAGRGLGRPDVVLLYSDRSDTHVWPLYLQSHLWLGAWLLGSLLWCLVVEVAARAWQTHGERQRDAHLAAVGRMAARLSHEIKNPLGAIRGAVQHLQKSPAGQSALLALVEQETVRLEELTRGVLDFARPAVVQVVPIDLVPVVREVVLLARQATAPRPPISESLPDGAPVLADAHAVRQILTNLINNAVEASTDLQPIEVVLRTERTRVHLAVTDRGEGMSEPARAQVFEPFFSTRPRGYGLGLAVSRRLAEAMAGTLDLRNRDGGGCIAELQLPAAPGEGTHGQA